MRQENAPIELVMISQPPDVELEELHDYLFDGNAGQSATIYIVDSGIKQDHPASHPN
jgi:subtilisin family serine protease